MKFKKQIKDIILLDFAYNDSWCQAGFAAADAFMDGTYAVRVHMAVLCGQLCRLPEIEQEFRKRFPYIKKVIADPGVILYSTVHKALKILCG